MAVKLSDLDRERLRKLADSRKRTPHWLAKEAISRFLDCEEAVEQLRLESLAAWEEYQRTGRSVSNQEVMTWLDSWGSEDETEQPV